MGQFVFQTNLGVNLKDAAKRFRHKFACGSKEEGEEIEIQGEVDDVIGEFIVKEWKHVIMSWIMYFISIIYNIKDQS